MNWIWMTHPELPDAPAAQVTEDAFTLVWEPKGFVRAEPPEEGTPEAAEANSGTAPGTEPDPGEASGKAKRGNGDQQPPA